MSEMGELFNEYLRVDGYMRLHYRKPLRDMVISDVPGYWKDTEARMHEGHPLHGCVGCEGPFVASYSFRNENRRGKFVSPYASWRIIRDATPEQLAEVAELAESQMC